MRAQLLRGDEDGCGCRAGGAKVEQLLRAAEGQARETEEFVQGLSMTEEAPRIRITGIADCEGARINEQTQTLPSQDPFHTARQRRQPLQRPRNRSGVVAVFVAAGAAKTGAHPRPGAGCGRAPNPAGGGDGPVLPVSGVGELLEPAAPGEVCRYAVAFRLVEGAWRLRVVVAIATGTLLPHLEFEGARIARSDPSLGTGPSDTRPKRQSQRRARNRREDQRPQNKKRVPSPVHPDDGTRAPQAFNPASRANFTSRAVAATSAF